MFETIARDVNHLREQGGLHVVDSADAAVRKWRRQFFNVCELVFQLNRTFGTIMLVSITQLFVGTITTVNFISECYDRTIIFNSGLVLMSFFINLWLLSYVAHRITKEVRDDDSITHPL